jgi:hypothetical protein
MNRKQGEVLEKFHRQLTSNQSIQVHLATLEAEYSCLQSELSAVKSVLSAKQHMLEMATARFDVLSLEHSSLVSLNNNISSEYEVFKAKHLTLISAHSALEGEGMRSSLLIDQ